MDLAKLSSPTPKSRIKTKPGKGGGKSLDYVDARFCMDRLDESVGPMNWRNEYKEVCGQLVCGVSIFDTQINDWVTKWDVGTESNFEAEKGHFSDAFKRACVHWGIGRDLYGEVGSSLGLQDGGDESSVGVAESVAPPPVLAVDDWEGVQIHFGKNTGVPLGKLKPNQLEWYQTKWSLGDKPSDDDLLLRKALDKSMKKGGTKDGFGG
jgi:hypothetical protein|tara:strand:+ start:294 stop:917 length:624 start_codon:yes stop_codon:yes gene_type:complete